MKQLRRRIRIMVVSWLIRFFTNAIKMAIAWEMTMAKQEECKHEGQEGTFCGLCGKELRDPDSTLIEEAVERVLTKHKLIKPGKQGDNPPKRESLAERLTKKRSGQ